MPGLSEILLVTLVVVLVPVLLYLNNLRARYKSLVEEHSRLTNRFQGVLDVEAEKRRITGQLERERAQLQSEIDQITAQHNQNVSLRLEEQQRNESELNTLQSNIDRLRAELAQLDEAANLQSFGFYRPHYDLASSERYQAALEAIRLTQKNMIKDGGAAGCPVEWAVNGSKTEGRKQINQTLKLLLRAFNGECDTAVAKVKYNNVHVMEARINKAWEAINKLASVQQCHITSEFLSLKIQELHLAHEYQEKLQAEKEEQRRIREQMREEEIAQRELEKARLDAEREEARYVEALSKARQEVEHEVGLKQQKLQTQIEALQARLLEAQANKERAIARAQMTRSGHVYVISNLGSFGEDVFKIGMTRRLDPLERVRELGDASVPFQFDVHAIIYSEDAPTLETTLHRVFNHRRVNLVNERKEFFRVSIDEITQEVRRHRGEIEITLIAEAKEYRQSVAKARESQLVFMSHSHLAQSVLS
jgi:hypothetical protein